MSVYVDPDHGPMATFVSAVWDPNYIRIGNYECDMVVDLNVKIGNVLRTENESRPNFIERPNVTLSLRPDIDITHTKVSPPPVLRRSRRIRERNNHQNENINIDGNRDPLQGGLERIGAPNALATG